MSDNEVALSGSATTLTVMAFTAALLSLALNMYCIARLNVLDVEVGMAAKAIQSLKASGS